MATAVRVARIYSSGAYSITRQAKIASYVTGYPIVLGRFDPAKALGVSLIFCNPGDKCNQLVKALRRTRVVVYMTTEGPFSDPEFSSLWKTLRFPIYANSRYTKAKIEESGYTVEDVVYHEIPWNPDYDLEQRLIPYLYIAGYQRRKWPDYIGPILDLAAERMVVATTLSNPYLTRYRWLAAFQSAYDMPPFAYPKLTDFLLNLLYAVSKIYLNLSDAEGFGLTPLEAMSHGMIPIVAEHPVFREVLGDCPVYVSLTGERYYEQYGPVRIEHYTYDVEDYIKKMEATRYSRARAMECKEKAGEHAIGSHYRRWLEL